MLAVMTAASLRGFLVNYTHPGYQTSICGKNPAYYIRIFYGSDYKYLTRKPRKGAAVIAASMHGFANCSKFKSPMTLTLTLDRV